MNLRFLLFLLLSGSVATAQLSSTNPVQFQGRITSESGQPVTGVVIQLLTRNPASVLTSAVSDTAGMFFMSQITPGQYAIRMTHTSYETKLIDSIMISANEHSAMFTLYEKAVQLDGIKVIARKQVLHSFTDRMVLQPDATMLKETVNVLDVLRMAPGVVVGDNEDAVSMAGKETVMIMLNGKEMQLPLRDVLKLLKSTAASSVSRVEIITNPSSRFDVRGNTGILSIWLKKNEKQGIRGSINASGSKGRYTMEDISNSLDYATKKWSAMSYLAYHAGKYYSASEQTLRPSGISGRQSRESNSIDKWSDPVWRLQTDYRLNAQHTISALVEMEKSTNQEWKNSLVRTTDLMERDTFYTADMHAPVVRKWNTYNFNYHFADTSGHDLSIDLDRSYASKVHDATLLNRLFTSSFNKTGTSIYSGTNRIIDIITARADYSTQGHSTGIKMEAGFKFSRVDVSNRYRVSREDNNSIRIDSSLTNSFSYRENIRAVYGNISRSFNKWGVQLGMRIEQTQANGNAEDLYGKIFRKPDTSYTKMLPSVFVNYSPGTNHAFRLSVTRRIARPDYESVRPVTVIIDPFNIETGNPSLRPQVNSNVEFAYTWKSKTALTINYNHAKDYFTTVNYAAGPILYSTPGNTGEAKDLSFALSHPQKITKWWTTSNRVSVFLNRFEGQVYADQIDVSKWGFTCGTTHRFTLPAKYMFTVSAWYNSSTRSLIYLNGSNASVGCSVTKKFGENDKASLKIGISDIFGLQQQQVNVNTSSVSYTQYNRWESRRVFIDFSFKFGGNRNSTVRDRQAGNGDERQRSGN